MAHLPKKYTLAAGIVMACANAIAAAQDKPADYPLRPIRIITGIGPGGGLDQIGRAHV